MKTAYDSLKRKITHKNYKEKLQKRKKSKWTGLLNLEITHNEGIETDIGLYTYIDDNIIDTYPISKVLPVWGGGVSLFLFMFFLYVVIGNPGEITVGVVIFIITPFLSLTFFVYYYFTMPHKEYLLNRKDGLITIPGSFWDPNITIPIENTLFSVKGASRQGLGGDMLVILRPNSVFPYLAASLLGYEKDLSFILWYMDKNRPLPPGTAFDEFRQRDFERRKAAGFLKPIFPSYVPTPEATPEQQAEREKIGGW